MTDSLAQIAAEQVADEAIWAAHPDPLSIAGDMQARAADRCARKRALWATDHCDSCPWRGCATCAYKGGVDPNAPVAQQDSGATRRDNRTDVRDNGRGNDERPRTGIRDLSEPLPLDTTEGEGLPTW